MKETKRLSLPLSKGGKVKLSSSAWKSLEDMKNHLGFGPGPIKELRFLGSGRLRRRPEVSDCKTGPESHCIFDMCSIRPGTPQPCVVIVGAGMAGLSAAARLVQCGITNFRILEAMDSPGGRVRTCWIGDTVVEAGWSHIESASLANPLFTLAAQERLLPTPLERVEHEGDSGHLVLTSEGRAIDPRLVDTARGYLGEAEIAVGESPQGESSLGEVLEAGMREKLKGLPKHERWDVARAFHGLLGCLKAKIGQSLNELSPGILSEMSSLPGGSVRVKGGMTSLLAPLLRNLPAGALVTCKPVSTILWGTAGPAGPRAVVRTCDGENFPADYVILTLPLGVLKASAEKMFCPQLPAFKMDAVRKLGFGSVNKIFLKFETPFWAEDGGDMIFAWTPEDLDAEDSWIKGVSSMQMIPGSKKVMSLTVSGADSVMMESLTDAEVARDLGGLLKRFLGSAVLPSPSEMLRSGWSVSPYSGGNKTYLSRSSGGKGVVHSLAAPLPSDCEDMPPILLFAGEHSHPEYLGTLHGSRLSGIREADRIVKLTKRFNGPPDKGPQCEPCS